MLKKFISLILTVSVLLSMTATISASSQALTKEDVAEQTGLLQKLGIVGSLSDEAEITRAEFAVMVAEVFKNDMASTSERYFVDVPEDHWSAAAVNTLVERGIISQSADRIFRMYDSITANEAIKMVISMCGYNDYAEVIGGYPVGYSNLARRLGINLKASNNTISWYEAYDLIYQALKLPLYDVNGVKGDLIISSQSDETLLSVYFDIYMTEGLVTQASGISLYPEKVGEYNNIADYVVIDKVTYTTDISLYDYLGRNATVFFYQPDKNVTPNIVYRETTGKEGDVIEITSKEFADYSNYVISYVDEESGRSKRVNLSSGVMVIKNGALCNSNLEEDISINKGYIRVIDKDSEGGADYVFISDYTNIVANIIDSKTYTVYDKVINGSKVELDPEEKAVFIENASGAKLGFSDITAGSVLTIYASKDYARVIVTSSAVTADIFAAKKVDGIQLIEVGKSESDRKWLELDEDYYNATFKDNGYGAIKLAAGAEITYYTDAYGKIAYITEPIKDNWTYAYLIGVAEGGDAFTPQAKVKMYMQTGEMLVTTVSDSVRVDGEKAATYAALCAKLDKVSRQNKTLQTGEDAVCGQLIRVKLNKDGIVSAIDTAYPGATEEKFNLQRTVEYGAQTYWYHADAFPAANLYYNSNTLRIGVPVYSQQLSAEDKYYTIRNSKYNNKNTSTFNVEAFKTDMSSAFAAVIVDYVDYGTTTLTTTDTAFMVDNVLEKVDSDGEVVYAVSAYATDSGDLVEYTAEDKSIFAGLEKGDLIQLQQDAMGKVADYTMLYDYGNTEFVVPWGHITNSGSWRESERYNDLVHYYVKTNRDGIMRLVLTPPVAADMTYNNINNADRFLGYKTGGPLIAFDGENITVTTLGEGILSAEITGVGAENIQDYWFSINLAKAISGVVYTD